MVRGRHSDRISFKPLIAVHSLMNDLRTWTTNWSLKAKKKSHWMNDKTEHYQSGRFIMITDDPITHQGEESFIVSSFWIHSLFTVYSVSNTGAQATILAVENWKHSCGSLQSIANSRRSFFLKIDFINWTKKLEVFSRPRTTHSPGNTDKVKTQKQSSSRYLQKFLSDAGNICSFHPSSLPMLKTWVQNSQRKEIPRELSLTINPKRRCPWNLNFFTKSSSSVVQITART